MKKIIVMCIFFGLAACQQTTIKDSPKTTTSVTTGISGPEALAKAIQYHDPEGKWPTFEGRVRMVTAFADGRNLGEEIIELRRSANYYKCYKNLGDFHSEKGVENGTCFAKINGNAKLSDEDIKKNNLSCETTRTYQYHHAAHIGWVMEAKNAGLTVNDSTKLENFAGKQCLAVSMEGKEANVVHPYWAGKFIMYLDPKTFALSGIRWEGVNGDKRQVVHAGEITVNGIRMQQAKIDYNDKDGSYILTDVFTRAEEN